jgi:hypothetical protein
MTTQNGNIPATPSTLAETTALIDSFSQPISTEETLEQKIVRLEAQLAEARTGNLKRPIEQPDGTTRSFDDVHAENQKLMEQWALEVESSRRLREEIAARSPVSYATPDGQLAYRPFGHTERPLLTEDDAVKEFGLAKWAALSPRQKAQARTVTKSDVDRVDLAKVFGRTSSGAKAMELSSENPALYRMAKRKARKEGLI